MNSSRCTFLTPFMHGVSLVFFFWNAYGIFLGNTPLPYSDPPRRAVTRWWPRVLRCCG